MNNLPRIILILFTFFLSNMSLAAVNLETTLSGSNQVPPTTSNVTGSGTFTYDFTTRRLDFSIDISNPDGEELTAMHIHIGRAGENGGVIIDLNLSATTSTTFNSSGFRTLEEIYEQALLSEGLYLNVHSSANPAGTARGQIVIPAVCAAIKLSNGNTMPLCI